MNNIIVKSNAKINLNLKIVGIKDGFHLINSIFIPIDVFDEIEFINSNEDEIIGIDIPIEKNIIYKAICLLRNEYSINQKVKVNIKKNIPMMAGLGGGSSNALFTLLALNDLWDLQLKKSRLAELAILLGSDVPFFLINKPSYVCGRGEIIKPVEFQQIKGILIFNDAYFSTKDVFTNFDSLGLELSVNNINYNNEIIINNNNFENDLEKAIIGLQDYQKVIDAINDLNDNGAYLSRMSGSGGSAFGLFDDDDKIMMSFNKLKKKYHSIWVFNSLK